MYTLILLSCIMGYHGNHEISYNENAFIFRTIFFLHLSGPIEQISSHNEMFYVFNVGLITPFDTSLSNGFPTFIIFH